MSSKNAILSQKYNSIWMREVTMASVAHEKQELSAESIMKRRCRNCWKNLNLKRARATLRKKRCVGQVWHRRALLEEIEKGPHVDSLFQQLARREIITKNVAPSRKMFQKRFVFHRCLGHTTKNTLHPPSLAPQRASKSDERRAWNQLFLYMTVCDKKTS